MEDVQIVRANTIPGEGFLFGFTARLRRVIVTRPDLSGTIAGKTGPFPFDLLSVIREEHRFFLVSRRMATRFFLKNSFSPLDFFEKSCKVKLVNRFTDLKIRSFS